MGKKKARKRKSQELWVDKAIKKGKIKRITSTEDHRRYAKYL
jgi:hypothetical protein